METPPEIAEAFWQLRHRAARFDDDFGGKDPDRVSRRAEAEMLTRWGRVVSPGRQLRNWVVETRAIPRGKAKAVELAFRAFETRRPRKTLKWWRKNRRHIDTLLEAESWPERGESDEDIYDIGPLVVHDTLHLTPSELERTLGVVEHAVERIQDAEDPFARVLYGPVYVVGRLRMPKHLAWYYFEEDVVYLRPQPEDTEREAFTLIHELGHRYWALLMDTEDREAWTARHRELSRTRVEVPTPAVGDLVPVAGHDEPIPILEIKYMRGARDPQAIVESGRIPLFSILKNRQREKLAEMFPTVYSMKNAEEHFAEAFAMHALGTLPDEHERFFQDWIDASASRDRNTRAALRA